MRKAGKQIRAALVQSERLGRWAIASELTAPLGMKSTLATKIMRRAVAYGLAEADDSSWPARFRALPNWRARVDVPGISRGAVLGKGSQQWPAKPAKPAKPEPAPEPAPMRRMFPRAPDRLPIRVVNSVWSLGGANA